MIICSLVRVLDNVKSSYLDEYIFRIIPVLFWFFFLFFFCFFFFCLALLSQFSSLGRCFFVFFVFLFVFCFFCFVFFLVCFFFSRLSVSHLVIFCLNFFHWQKTTLLLFGGGVSLPCVTSKVFSFSFSSF